MRLIGWNDVPAGFGARFEVRSAPLWLRLLFRMKILDRFAYPLVVRRGLGFLRAHDDAPPTQRGTVSNGWRLEADAYVHPGSSAELVGPRQRRRRKRSTN